MAQEHHIFSITEILEAILLHTDNVTLLTSAQRVCRHWHRLIQGSHALQCALFFKPTNKPYCLGQKRIQNPLIEENLWPQYFREELRTRPRGIIYKERQFPVIDAGKERAYLYVKASWKRMFTHQPPTSHVGIIETARGSKENHFSQLVLSPKGGFVRLEHLDNAVDSSTLMPGEEPLVF
ncbi:hypothetical protein ASPWEDRAFT_167135 [Aspergillus wentii DTO 134E9]|uniref:F-box domain-containing protein n=1 Tax=Aspergillus wentii DTO 134E9 TaxID=1073089 RepID=A0A1L9S1R1_ASPWE|nr:uncharacterized protein ASPWEDRAFT_167135 [Aspergillus wentii DTO 134E9]KAI9930910.1 hypothetical protein MW887_010561 [Aspergillus wentii]OJJ41102.1 hypothetical protein ASPWEDRAFT_167135 [Aspergillus wentii DTO 134E9]